MIGDSTAELDLMLTDLGVSVRYRSVSVKGLLRKPGETVIVQGIAVQLQHHQVRVRDGVLGSALAVETDIDVGGDVYRITSIDPADIEGLQGLTLVPRGA